ncbi:MAG: twitching motility response regulator PilH [Thiogranum sp.]|jgi:twitching motility two-component system response regulator PilH
MAQILIVDDSPTEAHVLRGILERNGFDVETAENGAEGIALARELRPDLVLMDVVMPGLNGFQATRQLSRDPQTSGIPVIIVTTKDQDTDRVWGLRQGARDFLTKPVSEKTLMEKISVVLELV